MLMLTVGHSSIQQPSIYSSDVTQRIDTDPIYPAITQGQMYSQAFYQPAMLGQYYGMDPRSSYNPYKLPGVSTQPFYSSSVVPRVGTNPQLISSKSVYPGMIQYPSGMSQQQIMGMSSNTSRARVVPTNMGVPHIGPADSRSVSFQSSSISNPNDVSLYSHSTNPAAGPPQLVYENVNNPSSSLPPQPRLLIGVSLLYCNSYDMLYSANSDMENLTDDELLGVTGMQNIIIFMVLGVM